MVASSADPTKRLVLQHRVLSRKFREFGVEFEVKKEEEGQTLKFKDCKTEKIWKI